MRIITFYAQKRKSNSKITITQKSKGRISCVGANAVILVVADFQSCSAAIRPEKKRAHRVKEVNKRAINK